MRNAPRLLCTLLAVSLTACTETPTSATGINDASFAKAPPSSNTPVSSAFDAAAPGLSSDGASYLNGSSGVLSILQAALGDWELDLTGNSSTRTMQLDFSDPVAGNPGTAPFQSALVKTRLIAKASQFTAGGFRGLASGASATTPLSVSFTYGGNDYAVRMNTNTHAGSDFARVTCTAYSTTCVQWSVTPTNTSGKNVGALELVGRHSNTFIGHFRMGFAITVAK